ncbi:MAG: oligopeptide transporter, OPT family [Euryarchaeota archaeon]|nr:oligopeptide transporter, OPT family [Euryarchaeota archaeon]
MPGEFVPYIPPEKVLPELTLKMVVTGIILTIVMAAANAYLGLYAGMTVSATIPAVVMALVFLRPLKGTVLEINLAKAMAVTGEALAAGVIFTFPALLVLYHNNFTKGAAGWSNLMDPQNLAVMMVCSLIGGLLGILLTIPLRRVMIIDLNLPYPEGVASAEVLKATDKGGKGMSFIFIGLGIGTLFKLAASSYGLRLWKEKLEVVIGGAGARLYGGLNLSPALLGVGYILGAQIASWVVLGGIIGWIILIPLIGAINGWPTSGFYINDPAGPMLGPMLGGVYELWFTQTMYVGVGAIVTGGMLTLWKLRSAIGKSLKGLGGFGKKADGPAPLRTERDFPVSLLYFVAIVGVMIAVYYFVTNNAVVAVVAAIVLLGFTFLFTAVAGYLAGVIGSSNNPISGVTVATLLFTAALLLGLSYAGLLNIYVGMTATIIVGAVVCCSAAIAGDSMQELKTGQLLGATPYNIQISRFIGVLVAAILIPPIVAALAQAYGIALPDANHLTPLPAPQAVVMATISKSVFELDINLPMIALGAALAFVLRQVGLSPMAVAIGIYLPFTLTLPIMLGGLIKLFTDKFVRTKVEKDLAPLAEEERKTKLKTTMDENENKGVLFASGLIAGEAIMGVIIAGIVLASLHLNLTGVPAEWPGLLVFVYVGMFLAYLLLRDHIRSMDRHAFVAQWRLVLGDFGDYALKKLRLGKG